MTTGAQQILAGRFRVESAIGHGGMGAVYVATDMTIGRRVAIKMLHPELAVEVDNLERLREEAFSLASIHHPNIVQLYDFHAGGPQSTFMVMELIEGENLSVALKRQPTFPVEVAIDYAQQILSALSAAHAKGIVHRDIKPGNLLVMSVPARRDLVKVLDFGIAKLTEATIRRRPTTKGTLLGTPTYMAPEQTVGAPVDPRTDVYAVALVLFRMISGMNPFEGYDLPTTLNRVASVIPPELIRFRPDVPPHVVHAVARALSKDPAHRPRTALEFARALGALGPVAMAPPMDMRSDPPPAMGGARGDPNTVSYPPNHAAPPPMLASASPQASSSLGSSGLTYGAAVTSSHPSGTGPSPKSSFLVGIGVGLVVTLLVGLTGTVAWLVSKQKAAPEVSAPDAAPTATASAPVASASASASTSATAAKTTVAPSTPPKTVPSEQSDGLGGTCSCLPDRGTEHHGNNMRVAPRMGALDCFCNNDDGASLCAAPIVPCNGRPNCDDSCKKRTFTSTVNAKCRGHNSLGELQDGKISGCQFPTSFADQYAGPAGRTCKGLTVDGKQVDGHVFCRVNR